MSGIALERTRVTAVRTKPIAVKYPREWIRPCLAGELGTIPSGARWVHEIKFDGYRTQLHLRPDSTVLYSRNGHDYTDRYESLAEAAAKLPARHVVLDAEVVVPYPDGRSDFWTLQKDVAAKRSDRLICHAFDLLFVDGRDLRDVPFIARKAMLKDLLGDQPGGRLFYSDYLAADGPMMLAQAHELQLEGVISKVVDSPYRAERVNTWIKTLCQYRETLPIVGYAIENGRFDGLYVARPNGNALLYGGKVEDGFDDRLSAELLTKLERFASKRCALTDPPQKRKARWIEPLLSVEFVHRGGYGGQGRVRHARFERIVSVEKSQRAHRVTKPAVRVPAPAVPAENVLQLLADAVVPTKEQLCEHWRTVAAKALPHIGRRPLKFVRHFAGTTYYHKGPLPPVPCCVRQLRIRKRDGTEGVRLWVDDLKGLLGLVEMGIVEVHPWASTVDDIEHPDMMVFDLDPGEGMEWSFVVGTALGLRDLLAREGYKAWPKLTGGKGLHLMVPIEPVLTHDAVHAYAKSLADQIAATDRDRYTTLPGAARRYGKLFVDYLRNGRGCTAIGAWSPRAREGFPVAAPVTWKQVERRDPS